MRWGNIRREEGFSDRFGLDRGLPVDRVYIATFLDRHAADIRGAVMEMSRSTYSDTYGRAQVTSLTIVDIDETNAMATLRCDLCAVDVLPKARFDCIIFTQTLQYLADLPVAADNLWSALRPGGVLLLTVPSLSRNDPIGSDFWRFTPEGLARRLSELLPGDAQVEVCGFGNAIAGAALLLGLAVEDVGAGYVDRVEPAFPVLAAARVVKPFRSPARR